mmetsp:Transcript_28025/g.44829  ORF Transcript_28025/g.44829 Transcript_28025/m.44829 type:complete len:108 (+) Transcript_28025:328-651(+)
MHSMAAHNDGNGRMMDDIVADTAHNGASDGPQPPTGDDYHGHPKLLRFLDYLFSWMPMSTNHIPLDPSVHHYCVYFLNDGLGFFFFLLVSKVNRRRIDWHPIRSVGP